MFKPTPRQTHFPKFDLRGTALLILAGALLGCRNPAYSDLYVESMASEIRQLEDQLYDYDNEYHILEQELASLKAENQQLRQAPGTPSPQKGFGTLPESLVAPSSPGPLKPSPPNSNAGPTPVPKSSSPNSILEKSEAPSGSRQPEDSLPKPFKAPKTEEIPKDLEVPEIIPGTPITIVPGTPLPPAMPVLKDFTANSAQPNTESNSPPANTLELNLSRIELPSQLASASGQRAQLKLGAEKPADMRIVELAFHSSLCRAANFDDESDDDGLYLVLQPKNVEGQLVPTFAALEIAVHDPARIGNEGISEASRIGRWTYSAHDTKSKFQPIGASQGIHLTLPWNGPDPQADRVLVYVRYTLPDGRQVVNDKTLFVSGKGNLKTVWVPRSDSTTVVTASGQQPLSSHAAGEDPASIPTNVIRPLGSNYELAPEPR